MERSRGEEAVIVACCTFTAEASTNNILAARAVNQGLRDRFAILPKSISIYTLIHSHTPHHAHMLCVPRGHQRFLTSIFGCLDFAWLGPSQPNAVARCAILLHTIHVTRHLGYSRGSFFQTPNFGKIIFRLPASCFGTSDSHLILSLTVTPFHLINLL